MSLNYYFLKSEGHTSLNYNHCKPQETISHKAEKLHQQGLHSFHDGNYELAANLIKQAVQINPDNQIYFYNLGIIYRQQGKSVDAIDCFQKAVQMKPDFVDAFFDMGVVFHCMQEYSEAIVRYEKTIQLIPDHFNAWYNMGIALKDQNKFAEALSCYQKALSIKPGSAETFFEMGFVYQHDKNLDTAIDCYQKAVQINPNHHQAWFNMGIAYRELEKFDEALSSYEKVITIKPASPDAFYDMGIVYANLGKNDEAIKCFQDTLRIQPDHAKACNNLGVVFDKQNKINEALQYYYKALSLVPYDPIVYENIGQSLISKGDKQKAEEAFTNAINLKPDSVRSYFFLAELKKYKEGDPIFNDLELLKLQKEISIKDKIFLYFSLGKLYDKVGLYESAFRNFHQGNELRKKDTNQSYSVAALKKCYNTLINTCDTNFFAKRSDFGIATELPVFIIGMPRSGTTLVEQILASHPKIFGADELPYLPEIETQIINSDSNFLAHDITALDSQKTANLALQYLDRINMLSTNSTRIVDKLPRNFERLWLITMLFPQTRIIHCRRHPMDTCLSCYFTNFTIPHGYKNDLKTLGLFYRQYHRLMEHWQKTLPVKILTIQYEDLVRNQEEISRKIIEFMDLEWDDRCLNFNKKSRFVHTASATQVRKKIYRTSIKRWKNYYKFLSPLIDALGGIAQIED